MTVPDPMSQALGGDLGRRVTTPLGRPRAPVSELADEERRRRSSQGGEWSWSGIERRGALLQQARPDGHADQDEYGTADKLASLSQTGAEPPADLQSE
jgi:hypothetical protein